MNASEVMYNTYFNTLPVEIVLPRKRSQLENQLYNIIRRDRDFPIVTSTYILCHNSAISAPHRCIILLLRIFRFLFIFVPFIPRST